MYETLSEGKINHINLPGTRYRVIDEYPWYVTKCDWFRKVRKHVSTLLPMCDRVCSFDRCRLMPCDIKA